MYAVPQKIRKINNKVFKPNKSLFSYVGYFIIF